MDATKARARLEAMNKFNNRINEFDEIIKKVFKNDDEEEEYRTKIPKKKRHLERIKIKFECDFRSRNRVSDISVYLNKATQCFDPL